MSGSLFNQRWVTSGTIPFDPWHKETHIGTTLCGLRLRLETMLSTLDAPPRPVRKCPTCTTLMRLDPDDDKEMIPA